METRMDIGLCRCSDCSDDFARTHTHTHTHGHFEAKHRNIGTTRMDTQFR